MSGSAPSLPIKLTLDGMPEVEARLNKVAQTARTALTGAGEAASTASSGMGRFSQSIQQGGYQLNDFVVQVQGGQSALTALSQQGSQFLGMFGPAGAAAGVILSIGSIAAGFLTAGENAKEAEKSAKAAFESMATAATQLKGVLQEVNGLFLTNAERSAAAANAARSELQTRTQTLLTGAVQRNEGNVSDLGEARAYLSRLEEYSSRQEEVRARLRAGGQMSPEGEALTDRGNLFQARARVQGLEQDISRTSEKIGEMNEALKRLGNAGRVGVEEYLPNSADPGGVKAFRASMDAGFKAEQEFAARKTQINQMLREGSIDAADADRLSALAVTERANALKKMDTSSRDAAKAERERAARDKEALGEVTALIKEQNQQYDQEQDRQQRVFDNSQQVIEGYKETLTYMGQESALISGNADLRGRELAVLKERQALQKQGVTDEEQIAERLRLVGEIYDKQLDFTQRKNSFDELARVGEQAFDRIGEAITQAFVSGKGEAVDFGNVAKAVLSEIAQAALRMAIVNPALNAMFGGSRGTVSGLMGSTALSSGAVSGEGGGGLVGYASQGAQAYSAYSKLSGINPTSYIQGTTPFNTGWGYLDGGLNSTISGIGAADATNSALGAMGNGVYGPATPGAVSSASGLTYGGAAMGALGVAGGLYGAYSGIQRGGVGGYTSAAGGAASAGLSAAAMAGAAVPVYGWIAAAALMVLGALLPGQKPSDRTGTATFYSNDPSNPLIGGLNGDRYSGENRDQAKSIGDQLMKVAQNVANVTDVVGGRIETAYRVAVGARDGLNVFFGQDQLHADMDEEGVKTVTKAFVQRILLQAAEQTTDEGIRSVIQTGGVDDPDATLANIEWYKDSYKGLSESLDPTKVNSYTKAVDALTQQYDEIGDKATSLGLSLEPVTAALAKGIEDLNKARLASYETTIQGMNLSAMQLSGGNMLGAQLDAFDVQRNLDWNTLATGIIDQGFGQAQLDVAQVSFDNLRNLQRQSIIDQDATTRSASRNGLLDRLSAADGSADTLGGQLAMFDRRASTEWTTAAADGITDLTLLARTQAEERLNIERNFNKEVISLDQQRRESAQDSAAGVISSLADYASSLSLGSDSPLSAQSKFSLAERQFNAVSGAALAGEAGSLRQLQSYSSDYLSAGRSLYGSTQAYADIYGRVQDVLGGVGGISADTLTATFMADQVQTQTQTLAERLDRLIGAVDALRREQQQATMRPAA
jgi:hypothetical protein